MTPLLLKKTLFNFFSGTATPFEKKMIEEWLLDDRHKEQYYEWLDEFQRENPQLLGNTEEAWQHMLIRIENPSMAQSESISSMSRNLTVWYWIAASISLLLLTFLGKDKILYQTYTSNFGEVRTFTLPDGSAVTLNTNSSLQVPRFWFGSNTREVLLKGEAEFKVIHTHNHTPFLVKTADHLHVKVLGTEFIVYTRDRGSKVILRKGSVLVQSQEDTLRKALLLKRGDMVTVKPNHTFHIQKNQAPEHYLSWKYHQFFFNRTPLTEIAARIEEGFGMKVKITDPVLAQRELTGTYKARSVDELLEVLAAVLDIKVSQKGNQITLSTTNQP